LPLVTSGICCILVGLLLAVIRLLAFMSIGDLQLWQIGTIFRLDQ
jgi:hypothetical protein